MGTIARIHSGAVTATCSGGCTRPLEWTVATQEHAVNVLNKHNREHHPEEPPFTVVTLPADDAALVALTGVTIVLDLTAAARAYQRAREDGYDESDGAWHVWSALLGPDADLDEVAADLRSRADRGETVHAYTPPF